MDFRVFILRHLELLNALGFWTIRVLFPRSLESSMDAYENAASELLTRPLSLSQTEELTWFLRQPQMPEQDASAAEGLVMNEIETTLESAPLLRSPIRRADVRRQFELSKSGDGMPILLTVGDAADLLRTTRRAIYAMLERRQLPGVIRIRRRVLIRSSELLEWLDQKRAPSLKD